MLLQIHNCQVHSGFYKKQHICDKNIDLPRELQHYHNKQDFRHLISTYIHVCTHG